MGKVVSEKTHTKQQLDNYANQHNPNNRAYISDKTNRAKQNAAKSQSQSTRARFAKISTWAPDYIEYDD